MILRRIAVAGAVIVLVAVGIAVGTSLGEAETGGPRSGTVGPSFEIVQMNLCGALGCYGDDVPDRFEVAGYAAEVLRSARADVAILNEVCFDQLDAVVRRLGPAWPMDAVSVETLATGNGCGGHPYGNAVLHRGSLIEQETIPSCEHGPAPCLDNPPLALSAEQRAAICATIRLPALDEPVTACSVHLVPRGRNLLGDRPWDDWHDAQLASLVGLVGGPLGGGGALVVGGDFNVGPDEIDESWPDGWTELDRDRRPTRPVPSPKRKIDFVMLSPGLRSVGSEVLDVPRCRSSRLSGHWCTDHHPIAGTVTID
jgi:endonuclease/exonuclease/phosphatase family metal-dependent hydrolase